MIIRTETAADYEKVFRLNVAAFGGRDDEAQLVERIRRTEQFVPELSIVAEIEDEIAGHLLLSEATVENDQEVHTVIALAPIAVSPNHQKMGIGGALIKEGIRRVEALGYDLILLIGHPDYYPKFGFQPARPHGLELRQFEVPDDVFMVCEVTDGALQRIKGELKYPPAFFG